MTFIEWISMGGYGAYIWAAYGITALILGSLGMYLWYQLQKAEKHLEMLKPTQKDNLF